MAYRDATTAGKISVRYPVDGEESTTWELLGAAGQGPESIQNITAAYTDTGLYIAALLPTDPMVSKGTIQVLRYSSGVWSSIPPGVSNASNPKLIAAGTGVALVYEDEDTATDHKIHIMHYNSSWVAVGTPWDPTIAGNDDIPVGYLDIAYESVTGAYVIAFYNSATQLLSLYTYTTSSADITPTLTADPDVGAVGVTADQGNIYLFYRNLESGRGTVMKRSGGTWAAVPVNDEQAGITGQFNLSELQIVVQNNLVYALSVDGGSTNVHLYR